MNRRTEDRAWSAFARIVDGSNARTIKPRELPLSSPTVIVEIVAILTVFVWTFWHLWDALEGVWQWAQTGDWVIDYSGGFMRRGFTGELLWPIIGDRSVVNMTLVVTLPILALVYALVFYLFLRSPRTPAWAMLVLSPGFLLFPYMNPDGALHKEILTFAALALLGVGFRTQRLVAFAIPAVVVYAVATLSHETAAFILPAFLFLLAREWRRRTTDRRTPLVIGAALSAFAAIGLLISVLFPGGASERHAICAHVAQHGIHCEPITFSYLLEDVADAQRLVRGLFPGYWSSIPILAVALVPLFAVRFLPRFAAFTILFAIAVAPIFVTGQDYGRWIWIAIASLSIVALSISDDAKLDAFNVPLYGAAAFCLSWGIIHYSWGQLWAPGIFERLVN